MTRQESWEQHPAYKKDNLEIKNSEELEEAKKEAGVTNHKDVMRRLNESEENIEKERVNEDLSEYINTHKNIILSSNEINEKIKKFASGSCFLIDDWRKYKGYDYFDLIYIDRQGDIVKVNVKEDVMIRNVKSFIDKQKHDPVKWSFRPHLQEQIKKELEELGFIFNIDEETQDELMKLIVKHSEIAEEERIAVLKEKKEFNF